MRLRRLSSRRLVAAWITGIVLLLVVNWAPAAWEAQQRAGVDSDLEAARSSIELAKPALARRVNHEQSLPGDSGLMALAASGFQLQRDILVRAKALANTHRTLLRVRLMISAAIIAGLLVLTWAWARGPSTPRR